MSSGLGWFCERLERRGGKTAAIWGGSELTYDGLWQRIASWRQCFSAAGLGTGDVCAIVGDQSSEVCAALLAGLLQQLIVVPLCSLSPERYPYCFETAQVQAVLTWGQSTAADHKIEHRAVSTSHPLLESLRDQKLPGIVLFSSGTTGLPKAVLWDAERLIARHRDAHRAYRTLVFLRLDHIGGLNTLFHVLCGGETLVVPYQRNLEAVCQAIERERVELLPTTPTFLKMLLLSSAVDRFDFSSLRRITYGTEPMHPGVLQSLAVALPNVDFKQTYGLSEVGILPTQSADRDSLWLKLGGGDVQTRVVDGQLWIRSLTAMQGYLNHPSPFDSDGWYNTQDAVETQGEYLRILGRISDIINVAGEKVYPAEVEDVLLKANNVREAVVSGRRNPITGQVVTARVSLVDAESHSSAERRLMAFCRQRLAPFQVPALIEITVDALHTERGKNYPANEQDGRMNSQQVALVSGGNRGLGAAIVRILLERDWLVATFSREETPFIHQCRCERPQAFDWQAINAANFDALRDWVMHVRDKWNRVDALVNNAALSREGRLTLQSVDDIHTLLTVNLESVIHLSRAAAAAMLTQHHGSIVNISSVNALRGHTGVAVYSATKAALDGLTRSLARELGASGIRVNSVAPGYFASALTADMSDDKRRQIVRRTPLGRLAEVDDIAGVVGFLLSPEAGFITGQTIVVDGGLTC